MDHPTFHYSTCYEYINSGRKINAIKYVREQFGLGLKESKFVIDKVCSRRELRNLNGQEYIINNFVVDFDDSIAEYVGTGTDGEFDDLEKVKDAIERLPIAMSDKTKEKIVYLIESAYTIGYDEGERIGFEQALMEDREDIQVDPDRMWEGTDG